MDGRDYSVLIKRLGLSLALIFTTRILFGLFNWDYFSNCNFLDMVYALIYGLRFDLSTVLIINFPFIFLSVIPVQNQLYKKFKQIVFVLSNSFFIFINILDMKFFSFYGKKVTYDIFLIGNDIQDQIGQIAMNYWYMILLTLVYIYFQIRLYPNKSESIMFIPKLSRYKVVLIGFIFILLSAVGIRGGIQLRSISPKQAYIFDQYELGNLSLNAAYTFIRTIGIKKEKPKSYFKTDHDARSVILNSRKFDQGFNGVKDHNIVILIVESLSQEYIEKGYTPYISEIAKKAYFSKVNYANGKRSIEALPSILAGLPSLLKKPIYQSQFQSNQVFSLPQVLKSNGYKTSFFHGGKRGTMDFDAYCSSIGIGDYYAKEDYPDQSHYDGHWGIYDHFYLEYFKNQLDSFTQPFFSTLFTLSSHQPYSIPKDYESTLLGGKLEIHKSIRYVDLSLKKFFEKAQESSWFKNTLFIITGDHTQKLETKEYNSLLGRYRVPLIFYHPTIDLSKVVRKEITQHADIFPSVLDFLNIETNFRNFFGSSVFNDDKGVMINYDANLYLYLKGNKLSTSVNELKKNYLVNLDTNNLEPVTEENKELEQELLAYIQYFMNGMIKNNLFSRSK